MSGEILLLSPYDALSHAYWRRGLVRNLTGYAFHEVTLPARWFSWRFRGNSLTLAHHDALDRTYDLIIATSMTDLAGLKGMRPDLSGVPSILYFHENQFVWPDSNDMHRVDRQLTSLYSSIAASELVFNSEFNRSTFLDGAAELLSRMPDHVPGGVVEALANKSSVLPVPLDPACFRARKTEVLDEPRPFTIIWNHRWESDKGVAQLDKIVQVLVKARADVRVHLLGQQFRRVPREMKQVQASLAENGKLGQCGFVRDRRRYLSLLEQSHLALSTAEHEFQGIAVLEAVAAGCVPLVPDRLVYRELFDDVWRYRSGVEALEMIDSRLQQYRCRELPTAPDVAGFSWQRQVRAWQALIDRFVDGSRADGG